MMYRNVRHGRGNFAVKLTNMIYQEYFRNSDFEDIWTVLSGFYGEDDGLKPKYETLVDQIKELPVLPEHSCATIEMQLDPNNEIMVVGAPAPQEWLLGREVDIDFSYYRDFRNSFEGELPNLPFDMLTSRQKRHLARQSDTATLAAHLLYWSTLYYIKTSQQHADEFAKWIEDSFKDVPHKYTIEQEYEAESRYRKQQKYWRNAVSRDSAIDWSANLHILKYKLEYNIGYWRYVQRHEGWEEDVKRMQIACKLIDASINYPNMEGIYVNTRNIEFEGEPGDSFLNLHCLGVARKEKAYRLLWPFLEHNMKKWWD